MWWGCGGEKRVMWWREEGDVVVMWWGRGGEKRVTWW